MKKKLLTIVATSVLTLCLTTSAFANVSESGDANKIVQKAKVFDYDDKGNENFSKNDSDKILFNGKTGTDNKNNYSEHNLWANKAGTNAPTSDRKYKYQKIVEGLVENELDENNKLKTAMGVYSAGEKVELFTGESIDYDLEFIKEENGVYVFSVEGDKDKGFLPLGKGNYFFGMEFGFTFTLSDNREGMIFEFAGDDDVWVFIDGKLVLDLGGIHSRVSGKIDFSSGTVSRTGQFKQKDGTYIAIVETKEAPYNLENGEHILKMFYLERGGNNSRCRISYKLEDVKPVEEPIESPDPSAEPSEEPVKPSEKPIIEPTYQPIIPIETEVPSEEPSSIPNVEPTQETTVEPIATKPVVEPITKEEREETPVIVKADKVNKKNPKKVEKNKPEEQQELDSVPQTGDPYNVKQALIIMLLCIFVTVGLLIHHTFTRRK